LKTFLLSAFAGMCIAGAAQAELYNLRNACDPWEAIPANEYLKSPIAALLTCSDDNGARLALQIMCHAETAEIEFRYRPGYPIGTPKRTEEPEIVLPEITAEVTTETTAEIIAEPQESQEPKIALLGAREMLFFDFSALGFTAVVDYDHDAKDWSYVEKEPLSPMFLNLIRGNYADVNLLATGQTERLPLRGSTKALRPVVETCRLAKRKLDRAAKAKN